MTRPSFRAAQARPALGRVYYCNKTYDPLPPFLLVESEISRRIPGRARADADGSGGDPYIVTFGATETEFGPRSELKGEGREGI